MNNLMVPNLCHTIGNRRSRMDWEYSVKGRIHQVKSYFCSPKTIYSIGDMGNKLHPYKIALCNYLSMPEYQPIDNKPPLVQVMA